MRFANTCSLGLATHCKKSTKIAEMFISGNLVFNTKFAIMQAKSVNSQHQLIMCPSLSFVLLLLLLLGRCCIPRLINMALNRVPKLRRRVFANEVVFCFASKILLIDKAVGTAQLVVTIVSFCPLEHLYLLQMALTL